MPSSATASWARRNHAWATGAACSNRAARSTKRPSCARSTTSFNRSLRFTDDIEIWQQEDYWATPVEALVKGAADCEDYAIAKYVTLRRLGVASDKLRITLVKALRLNQAHMVLTWYASPGADPLVLDNLIGEIRPASQRDDLLPVYAFNAEGLWLPGADGGRRTGDSKKLSRWQDLLTKMRAEGLDLDAPKED